MLCGLGNNKPIFAAFQKQFTISSIAQLILNVAAVAAAALRQPVASNFLAYVEMRKLMCCFESCVSNDPVFNHLASLTRHFVNVRNWCCDFPAKKKPFFPHFKLLEIETHKCVSVRWK
jgi:hypothetical protein